MVSPSQGRPRRCGGPTEAAGPELALRVAERDRQKLSLFTKAQAIAQATPTTPSATAKLWIASGHVIVDLQVAKVLHATPLNRNRWNCSAEMR